MSIVITLMSPISSYTVKEVNENNHQSLDQNHVSSSPLPPPPVPSSAAALARFKATARATTLALTTGLSSNGSSTKMTREEAADLITNSLVDAVDGGTTQGTINIGASVSPYAPTSPLPLSSPPQAITSPHDPQDSSQITALLAQQPELSISEAARALAVSHAVKVIRAKRGCSAAEAIDELR